MNRASIIFWVSVMLPLAPIYAMQTPEERTPEPRPSLVARKSPRRKFFAPSSLTQTIIRTVRVGHYSKLKRLLAIATLTDPTFNRKELLVPVTITTPRGTNEIEGTLLHLATALNRTSMMEFLIEEEKLGVSNSCGSGFSPLKIALVQNKPFVGNYLVKQKKVDWSNDSTITQEFLEQLKKNGNEIASYLLTPSCPICFEKTTPETTAVAPCMHIFCKADMEKIKICAICRTPLNT